MYPLPTGYQHYARFLVLIAIADYQSSDIRLPGQCPKK